MINPDSHYFVFMCGIAGFLGKGNKDTLIKMADSLKHRGPDSVGYFYDEKFKIGLAHSRLSIIDIAGGSQPIYSEDGKKAIIFNGEIYNFRVLKKDLEHYHKFKTNSDTEVILHLYEDLGEKCLTKLEGMFSFAIYDKEKEELFLARDRFGEKPLYFTFQKGVFVFGSELKAVICHTAVKKELDFLSLSKFLTYEYVPSPNTIFKNIFKLELGHYLIIDKKGDLIKKQYFDVGDFKNRQKSDISFNEALKLFEYKLENAVSMRLVSDVPLGVFLSGGIDSSSIAYFASKNSSLKIKTFSIGFNNKSFDESKYARQVSEFLKTEHHTRVFSEYEMRDALPKVFKNLDEPFADPSVLPAYLLSKFTKEHVTVALGGDGGDELLLGYPMFQADFPRVFYSKIPKIMRKRVLEPALNFLPVSTNNLSSVFLAKTFAKGVDCPSRFQHQVWISGFEPYESLEIFTENAAREVQENIFERNSARLTNWCGFAFEDLNELYRQNSFNLDKEKINYLYLKQYLADDILVKVDRAAMLASLETRSPFLDTDLAEFIISLPYNFKLRGFKTKYIFKKMMEAKLPKEIVWRKKKGFGIPLTHWLQNDLKDLMREELNSKKIKREGIFNPEKVELLMNEHLSGKRDNRKKLWPLMCFQMWRENWYK